MTTGVSKTGITGAGRRLAAWLGMVVVCFNLAAAWGLPLSVPPVAAGAMVPVCTNAGMVLVPLEDDLPGTREPSSGPLCQHCLPFLHDGGLCVPMAAGSLSHAVFPAMGAWPQRHRIPRPHDPRHLFSARAPPGF